jgi:hypothetical protein
MDQNNDRAFGAGKSKLAHGACFWRCFGPFIERHVLEIMTLCCAAFEFRGSDAARRVEGARKQK